MKGRLKRLGGAVRYAILVGGFSLVAALALGEAYFRWLAPPAAPIPVWALRYFPYLENIYLDRTPGQDGPSEPSLFGYQLQEQMYQFRSREPVRYAGQRFEGAFQFKQADALDTSAFRIFILGGSTAWGINIKDEEKYFVRLERMIKRPYPVKIIPAAVIAVNSTQEMLLFNLLVLPNRPDMVVMLDGYNDANQPVMFGARPGDPYTMSTLYRRNLEDFFGLKLRLAEWSSLARRLMSAGYARDAKAQKDFVEGDREFRETAIRSVVDTYLSNVESVLAICRDRGIPAFVALQPSLDLLDKREGRVVGNMFVADAYERVVGVIGGKSWASSAFVDLLHAVSRPRFSDYVHFDSEGQEELARALLPEVDKRLPAQWTPPARRASDTPR